MRWVIGPRTDHRPGRASPGVPVFLGVAIYICSRNAARVWRKSQVRFSPRFQIAGNSNAGFQMPASKSRPMRGRTLRSASRAFIPPWSPACSRGTVGSRTSRLSRARNPSRQRQEALRRSLLSRLMHCNRRATAGSADTQRRFAARETAFLYRRPTVMRSLRPDAHCKCAGACPPSLRITRLKCVRD